MRKFLLVLVAPVLGLGLFAAGPAVAKPAADGNHGQCVSSSDGSDAKGGRSAVARDKDACKPKPLTCVTNGTASRDSAADTVTVTGTGPGSAGSSLECSTSIDVVGGESTITFDYDLTGDACGGGVPRIFVQIGGSYYNTVDGDPECGGQGTSGSVSYTIPVSGTVTTVGFVYDRGDLDAVTYDDATVGGVVLDL